MVRDILAVPSLIGYAARADGAELRAAAGSAKRRGGAADAGDRAGARGGRSQDAAETCGMDRQTLRDWVHRYNAEGLDGLRDRPRRRPPAARSTAEQQAALTRGSRGGSEPEARRVVRWRRVRPEAT